MEAGQLHTDPSCLHLCVTLVATMRPYSVNHSFSSRPRVLAIREPFQKTYRHIMSDSLRRNSSMLILSQAVNAAAGFLFWIICAHLFTTTTVGFAVSIISFGTLVSSFTTLGLPNTFVRFLPTSVRKGPLFAGALSVLVIFSVIGALLSILLVGSLVEKLRFVEHSFSISILLCLLVVGFSATAFMDGTLISFRGGKYILRRALLCSGPRCLLPFILVSMGLSGIVSTYVAVLIIGLTYSILVTTKRLMIGQSFRPSFKVLREHGRFAAGNYFGGVFAVLSGTLLPIIVLARLGASGAAYWFMPMQIAFFLNFLSSSTSQALVAEASQTNQESLQRAHFRNAAIHMYRLLIPVAALLICLGWPMLRLYGVAYAANGYLLLVILCISSGFVGINWLGDTWLNIQRRPRAYFLMNAFNAVIVIGAVYASSSHGLVGVGLGYLLGQCISALVYLGIFARSHVRSIAR